jgi:hypothetical protein
MCQLGKPDTNPLTGQTQLYCRTGLHNLFDMECTYAFTLTALSAQHFVLLTNFTVGFEFFAKKVSFLGITRFSPYSVPIFELRDLRTEILVCITNH